MKKRFISVSELSERWGIGRSTLYHWIMEGDGRIPPHIKIGPRVRFDLDLVEAWEREQMALTAARRSA